MIIRNIYRSPDSVFFAGGGEDRLFIYGDWCKIRPWPEQWDDLLGREVCEWRVEKAQRRKQWYVHLRGPTWRNSILFKVHMMYHFDEPVVSRFSLRYNNS